LPVIPFVCHSQRESASLPCVIPFYAVIPTGATDGCIVRRAVEGPPHFVVACFACHSERSRTEVVILAKPESPYFAVARSGLSFRSAAKESAFQPITSN
jgi:hypothetical protein